MIRALHTKKGFTLIELMIVVAIIGILAAIAIPNFLRFQAKSKQSEAKTNLGSIGTTAESYRVEKDTYVISSLSDLGWAPTGTPRYSYWYAVGATPTNFNPGLGTVQGCSIDTAPGVSVVAAAPGTFTAAAKGQIDTDPTCDEWSYTQARQLNNDLNDVSS
jgi:type IV pilus assembly protein PilA